MCRPTATPNNWRGGQCDTRPGLVAPQCGGDLAKQGGLQKPADHPQRLIVGDQRTKCRPQERRRPRLLPALQVSAGETLAEPSGISCDRGEELRGELLRECQHLREQLGLRPEVVDHQGRIDARRGGDSPYRRPGEPVGGEQFSPGCQDRLAGIAARPATARPDLPRPDGCRVGHDPDPSHEPGPHGNRFGVRDHIPLGPGEIADGDAAPRTNPRWSARTAGPRAGVQHACRVRGSPNRGRLVFSNLVSAQIWCPARVSTKSPEPW